MEDILLDADTFADVSTFKKPKKKKRKKKSSKSKNVVSRNVTNEGPKIKTNNLSIQTEKLQIGRPAAVLDKKIKTFDKESGVMSLAKHLSTNIQTMGLIELEKIVTIFKPVFIKKIKNPVVEKEMSPSFVKIVKVIDKVLGEERQQSYEKVFTFSLNAFLLYTSSLNPKHKNVRANIQKEFGRLK